MRILMSYVANFVLVRIQTLSCVGRRLGAGRYGTSCGEPKILESSLLNSNPYLHTRYAGISDKTRTNKRHHDSCRGVNGPGFAVWSWFISIDNVGPSWQETTQTKLNKMVQENLKIGNFGGKIYLRRLYISNFTSKTSPCKHVQALCLSKR